MVNYIVSGCPRSGTSMTMMVLANAGLQIAKDDKRIADDDNKHGYYEIENIINKIKDNPDIVFEYDDMILKVTHYGIQYLPKGDYKIIYIERDIDEVLDSMEKMMGRKDENREKTRAVFLKLNEKVKKIMEERDDINFLIINHRDMVLNPSPVMDKIIDFFEIDQLKKEDMVAAIDSSMYRNRRV